MALCYPSGEALGVKRYKTALDRREQAPVRSKGQKTRALAAGDSDDIAFIFRDLEPRLLDDHAANLTSLPDGFRVR